MFKEGRRISRRDFLKGLGLTAGALTLSGLSLSFKGFSQPAVVKVGTLFPYTGPGSEWGPHMRNTADLCAGQINEAAEELLGGPVLNLIHEDTETMPSPAVDRARKLVEVDRVPVLIGSWSSGVTIAVAESVTMPAAILHVVPVATSPFIGVLPADTQDLLFRTIASDAIQGVVAAQLARGEIFPGYKFDTASVIFVDNPYGRGLAEQFARSFEKRGGKVLAQVPHPEEPLPTYTAELEKALAGKPEVLLPINYPGHAVILLKECLEIFDYTSWQFPDALKSLRVFEAIGGEVLAGRMGTVQAADPKRAGFIKFAEAYKEAYGEMPPLPFLDTTYDAVAVTGLAVAKCAIDKVEPTPFNIRDRLRPVATPPGTLVGVEEFKAALEALIRGEEIDYSGAAGEVNFDERGEVITPIEIWMFTEAGITTVMIRSPEEIPPE
ncbi:TPA: twin-arginine translocation signal domain-containing protein [Candidatus Bipolaricaulota bacterium]|nr:twin-arginine translocation signal domain-containing protein [Candidatus Bipolaricaulota bacterium]